MLYRNPAVILIPQIVLEIGPGMGFFTLPMARMVGEKGKI
jgi:tRNA A58 N-methylase Trm61